MIHSRQVLTAIGFSLSLSAGIGVVSSTPAHAKAGELKTYKFVEIGDVRMHYDERGSGEALVLIHAGIAHLGMWDAQMEAFSKHFRVIRYDVRGYGATPDPPGEYTDFDELKMLLDSLGVRRAHLIGISNGGRIALDFAVTHPAMVERLIVVAPGLSGFAGQDDPFESEMYAQYDKAIKSGDTDRAAEIEARVWVDGPRRKPEQVDQVFRRRALQLIKHRLKLGEGHGENATPRPPTSARLGDIKAPTLLVLGQGDVAGIFEVAKALESGIPNLKRVDLPGTAHLPPMEKPEEFNRIVMDFLLQK